MSTQDRFGNALSLSGGKPRATLWVVSRLKLNRSGRLRFGSDVRQWAALFRLVEGFCAVGADPRRALPSN